MVILSNGDSLPEMPDALRFDPVVLTGDAAWIVVEGPGTVSISSGIKMQTPDGKGFEHKGSIHVVCQSCGSETFSRVEKLALTYKDIIVESSWIAAIEEAKRILAGDPQAFNEEVRQMIEKVQQAEIPPGLAEKEPPEKLAVTMFEKTKSIGMDERETLEMLTVELLKSEVLEMCADLRAKVTEAVAAMKQRVQEGEFPPFEGSRPGHAMPRIVRLTCSECGSWTVVEPFGPMPDRERWLEQLSARQVAPSVVRVEFDTETMCPRACVLDGVYVAVIKTLDVAHPLRPDSPLVEITAAGQYRVDTALGEMVLEAVPEEEAGGTLDWSTCIWSARFENEKALRKWLELKAKGSQRFLPASAEGKVVLKDPLGYAHRAYLLLEKCETRLRAVIRALTQNDPQDWWRNWWNRKDLKRPAPPSAEDFLAYHSSLTDLKLILQGKWKQGALRSHLDQRDFVYLDEVKELRDRVMHFHPFGRKELDRLHFAVSVLLSKLPQDTSGDAISNSGKPEVKE